jgi:hypothetical protein
MSFLHSKHMGYFSSKEDAAVLRQRFKELARRLHPDKSGKDGREFAAMRAEYDAAIENEATPQPSEESIPSETLLELVNTCRLAGERWPLLRNAAAAATAVIETRLKGRVLEVHPDLCDLLIPNVIQLERDGETIAVPPWHGRLVYEPDLVVVCEPRLPAGVAIDSQGDLHVSLASAPQEVVDVFLGGSLSLAHGTSLILRGKGIPVSKPEAIYDVSARAHVYLHA